MKDERMRNNGDTLSHRGRRKVSSDARDQLKAIADVPGDDLGAAREDVQLDKPGSKVSLPHGLRRAHESPAVSLGLVLRMHCELAELHCSPIPLSEAHSVFCGGHQRDG